mmetsp:Transcript_13876/g.35975  ORF Transcript_13876/g.35975 Transcript_13876/m.35975 type:complete len:204 (-) Transcript_13876:387-998(-)
MARRSSSDAGTGGAPASPSSESPSPCSSQPEPTPNGRRQYGLKRSDCCPVLPARSAPPDGRVPRRENTAGSSRSCVAPGCGCRMCGCGRALISTCMPNCGGGRATPLMSAGRPKPPPLPPPRGTCAPPQSATPCSTIPSKKRIILFWPLTSHSPDCDADTRKPYLFSVRLSVVSDSSVRWPDVSIVMSPSWTSTIGSPCWRTV